MKAVIKSVKQAIESDSVIVTNVLNGKNQVRIDARSRFHVADANNLFSKWVSFDYANRLYKEKTGRGITDHPNFKY